MKKFEQQGLELRRQAKELILELLNSSEGYGRDGKGIRTANIFRECGLDWGDYLKARSTAQQYWVVAALRELESEGLIERVSDSGPWRLR